MLVVSLAGTWESERFGRFWALTGRKQAENKNNLQLTTTRITTPYGIVRVKPSRWVRKDFNTIFDDQCEREC